MNTVEHLEGEITRLKTALQQECQTPKRVALLNDLSGLLLQDKQSAEALKYAKKAIEIIGNQSTINKSSARAYLNAGDGFAQQQQYISALTHYQTALKYCEKDSEEQAEILLHMVAVYVDSKQKNWSSATFNKAIEQLNWLVDFYEKKQEKNIVIQLHKQLYQLHKQLRNFEIALKHYETYYQERERAINLQVDNIHELKEKALRFQQLADYLNTENERLHESVHLEMKKFIDIIAHDFRSPLNHIKAFTELLKMDAVKSLGEEQVNYINLIEQSGQKLRNLLYALIQYSKIGWDNKPLEDVDLEQLINLLKTKLQQKIAATQAQIVHVPLPTIKGHSHRFFLLFYHLLDNALKFKHPERPANIHISLEESALAYTFHIKDNGIGMNSMHYERIFNVFKRLHTAEEYEGTGIGLAICKKIVANYGGKIKVSAILDKGSTFHVMIPKKNIQI